MRSFIAAASLALLSACAPMFEGDLPNGDHVVTSYVLLQGGQEARDDNLQVAHRTCHGGVVLIREESGIDEYGAWRRLVYGCLAERAAAAPRAKPR